MEGLIFDTVIYGRVDEALSLMTPDIARKGVMGNNSNLDILTYFCDYCETEEYGLYVANALIGMGYNHNSRSYTNFSGLITRKYWKLFHFVMRVTKSYTNENMLDGLFHKLNRKQLEPFIEHGAKSEWDEYNLFCAAREKARIASIALIGAGKQQKSAKDVFRVISRVVWSERDDEKWMKLK